jgi:aspartyl-tRNA(Asn)/glutamyl-tRNA(Gln) amidotransferase subunit A
VDDLTGLTIADAASAIARGEVSPTELTQAYLARIEKLDPELNAFVTVTADRAVSDARRASDDIAGGDYRGPLHGIPIGLKDLVDTAGIRTAGGAKVYADRMPATDATVARLLADAGTILLGKLNTHELAFGLTTTNPHFGATRNPYDTTRIPGGSSGGSGAATTAHMTAAALGTDTGASIRVPAALCGCVGLKPTYGRVSAAGVMSLSRALDHVGPLTRTVEDAAIMLGAIAGYDPADAVTVPVPVPDYRAALERGVSGLRVGVPRSTLWALLDDEVRAATDAATTTLAGLGATLVEVELPDAAPAFGQPGGPGLWSMAIEESRYYNRQAWADRPADFGDDLRMLYSVPPLDGAGFVQSLELQRNYSQGLRQALVHVDLLVCPTTPIAAPPIGADTVTVNGVELPVAVALTLITAPFNLAGLPAISVPCGFTAGGLPIGLQLAGRPFAEETVLQAAHAYERATDWHNRSPS